MAMAIVYNNGSTDQAVVGKSIFKTNEHQSHFVTAVVCSDDELKQALKLTGLPDCGKPMMTFYGDFAKHIVGNWY